MSGGSSEFMHIEERLAETLQRVKRFGIADSAEVLIAQAEAAASELAEVRLERNNFEGSLQLSEEALYFALRDAKRYAVVRSHAADVTPEEMDRGADEIIAQRAKEQS
jgi:hypothetical protein